MIQSVLKGCGPWKFKWHHPAPEARDCLGCPAGRQAGRQAASFMQGTLKLGFLLFFGSPTRQGRAFRGSCQPGGSSFCFEVCPLFGGFKKGTQQEYNHFQGSAKRETQLQHCEVVCVAAFSVALLGMLTRVHSQLLWMTLRTFDPWDTWTGQNGVPFPH